MKMFNISTTLFLNDVSITGENSLENKFSPVTLFYTDLNIIKCRWSREIHYWNERDGGSLVGDGKEYKEEEYIAGLSQFKQNV